MSNDTADCGCEGHADNFGACLYPVARLEIKSLERSIDTADRKVKDLEWESRIQAELIQKLTEDNRQLLKQLHGVNEKVAKAFEKAETTKRSLVGEIASLKLDVAYQVGEALEVRDELKEALAACDKLRDERDEALDRIAKAGAIW